MRTITLELLRHGPAHNQLLSPLTPYLALCENHAAVTLHVPFEHNQFLYRLSSLGYQLKEDSRTFQLHDTAKVMGEILAQIPGLTAESGKTDHSGDPLTHLRLIISASELALLPFELALSPVGFPGSGQHLLLQPQMPICLTREIRRAPGEQFQWTREPRILFIAASPPDVGPIPLESHLLALRRLIAPWVRFYGLESEDNERFYKQIEKHLVVLPNASVEAIEKECATTSFTHVHILAHGVERKENYDTRFFLALHNSTDPYKTDYINGARLATALRPSHRPDSSGLAKPVVVTLASCDSGNVGSVAGAGASIAHALHESGIPMVIAGQFPLSFEGSVCLVDCLYEGLLWGTDPRRLLYDLRRRLFAQFPDKHDWASLTAYVSLPPDFDKQLSSVQIGQAMGSIDAAMDLAAKTTQRFYGTIKNSPDSPGSQQDDLADFPEKEKLLTAMDKVTTSKEKLEGLLDKIPQEKVLILSKLASTEKRHAELLFLLSQMIKTGKGTEASLSEEEKKKKEESDKYKKNSLELLKSARNYYWNAFSLDRSKTWALVQYLSLATVLKNLNEAKDTGEGKRMQDNLPDLWDLSNSFSSYDLQSTEREQVIWTHGNLVELNLLAVLLKPKLINTALKDMIKHTDSLIDLAGRQSFEVYSTQRQIMRYIGWFNKIAAIQELIIPAKEILERFPETEDADFLFTYYA